MNNKDQEFMNHLLAIFKVEADEHLKMISSGLIELEKTETPDKQGEIVEVVFREAHSLKGAARSVNLTDLEALCQMMEGVFAAMKRHELKGSPELFDLLQQAVDHIGRLLPVVEGKRSAKEKAIHKELIGRLEEAAKTKNLPPIIEPQFSAPELQSQLPPQQLTSPESQACAPERVPHPAITETVRVATTKLSSVLLQSEEMLSAKLAAGQRVVQMRETRSAFAAWKKEWGKVSPVVQAIRKLSEKPAEAGAKERLGEIRSELARLFDFLEWNGTFMKSLEGKYAAEAKTAEDDSRALGGMVNNLLDDMKKVMMFPFSSLLEIFPKVVRDLSRDHGKEVALDIRGGEIEVDRRILEEMKDPLVHLVRNCIDHGIEGPGEREGKNKGRHGTVTISVAPKDNKVEVVVADDGAGIGIARIRGAVQKLGLVSPEKMAELSDGDLLLYVFQSGVSTSPIITEISGRGLGLAIVREKVEKLGGTVSLESQPDAGTTFRILLPLTVATFRGILVRSGEQVFVLPTTHVERVVRLKTDEIRTVENRETIHLDGRAVSLARLGDVLRLPARKQDQERSDRFQAVVLAVGDRRIAFLADEIMNEQEVLLKNLGPQLSRVRNFSGATVLGSGKVVPILNVPDLMKSAVTSILPFTGMGLEAREEERKRESVLVVEDSITSRTLLKNILESAGYDVATAVDGIDAFTRLRNADFDLVVSDVDMPRMNGFDLTAKIRGDKKLSEMPIVLVTALESREDRERGIDVGANAYIVKSSFDQSNLLEVIRRLV
ncbi:MAG: hybrid sensor histidine kinase/response regulator [Desulfurivibrionaceae bacterium]|jgi:two-component system chemotaxis sensor kinase CheA